MGRYSSEREIRHEGFATRASMGSDAPVFDAPVTVKDLATRESAFTFSRFRNQIFEVAEIIGTIDEA